ncbi:MAG: hypothetical protein RMX65_022865 [Nostoc sp. DedQUE01]|nr:hypothetical protein [Nostoc sp. DedQUE11]MDZ8077054.1 hypothetical protein [Nostoc sp. DedQUE01]
MPETLVETFLTYYFIAFDANGKERENNGKLISQKVINILYKSRQSEQ